MSKFVILDCLNEPPKAHVFRSEDEAKAKLRILVTEGQKKLGLPEEDLGDLDFDSMGYLVDGIISCTDADEGTEGFFMAFSSADRSNFMGPWPTKEWLGNGDPVIFKTRGVQEGTVEGSR
jgi:hypothetical protein